MFVTTYPLTVFLLVRDAEIRLPSSLFLERTIKQMDVSPVETVPAFVQRVLFI